MIVRKIESSLSRLRELADRIPQEHQETAHRVIAVLDECADIARHLEAAALPITAPAPSTHLH